MSEVKCLPVSTIVIHGSQTRLEVNLVKKSGFELYRLIRVNSN